MAIWQSYQKKIYTSTRYIKLFKKKKWINKWKSLPMLRNFVKTSLMNWRKRVWKWRHRLFIILKAVAKKKNFHLLSLFVEIFTNRSEYIFFLYKAFIYPWIPNIVQLFFRVSFGVWIFFCVAVQTNLYQISRAVQPDPVVIWVFLIKKPFTLFYKIIQI